MIAATIYNIETGLIDRTVTVAEADIEANCNQGESWIEGVYSPDEYVVRDGSLVKLVSIKLWPYQDCNFTIAPHTEKTKIEGIQHGLV